MAVWFFWIALGEQLVPQLLGRAFPALRPALGLLPFNAAQRLLEFAAFDAAAYQRLVQAAQEAEQGVPELPGLALSLGVNAAWVLAFLGVSYLLYQRKDL